MSAPGGDAARRGAWIPWLFAAFFGVVVVVNGIMVFFALDSFSGLQTRGHYQRGLDYNRVIAAERAEQALGWSVHVGYEPDAGRRGRVVVQAADRDGAPLAGAEVTVRMVRPVQDGFDRTIKLAAAGDGLYAATVELPLAGQWDIQTLIRHPSGSFRTSRRIVR